MIVDVFICRDPFNLNQTKFVRLLFTKRHPSLQHLIFSAQGILYVSYLLEHWLFELFLPFDCKSRINSTYCTLVYVCKQRTTKFQEIYVRAKGKKKVN